MSVVLITGSSRNIGKALALRFAAAGHEVVVNARDAEQAQQVATEIERQGGRAIPLVADVTDTDAVEAMVAEAAAVFGPVGILINNAVLRVHQPLLSTTDQDWQRVLDVVLGGAFRCSRAVIAGMRQAGGGRIINIAGVSGQRGGIDRSAVVTAKSGLIGLTKALALELAPSAVTVNCVSPGLIATNRGSWTAEGEHDEAAAQYERVAAEIPLGRMGDMDEVAATCVFLASPEAGFITGQTIAVNGGLYL